MGGSSTIFFKAWTLSDHLNLLAGPVIVVSPPPSMLVEQSYTFVINCTAMGIPTPEIGTYSKITSE